jgi:hypothetical protein
MKIQNTIGTKTVTVRNLHEQPVFSFESTHELGPPNLFVFFNRSDTDGDFLKRSMSDRRNE